MRKVGKPTEQESNEGPQRVSFQIANGNSGSAAFSKLSSNEGTGAEVPSHKLANHRKNGARRSRDGNL